MEYNKAKLGFLIKAEVLKVTKETSYEEEEEEQEKKKATAKNYFNMRYDLLQNKFIGEFSKERPKKQLLLDKQTLMNMFQESGEEQFQEEEDRIDYSVGIKTMRLFNSVLSEKVDFEDAESEEVDEKEAKNQAQQKMKQKEHVEEI